MSFNGHSEDNRRVDKVRRAHVLGRYPKEKLEAPINAEGKKTKDVDCRYAAWRLIHAPFDELNEELSGDIERNTTRGFDFVKTVQQTEYMQEDKITDIST